MSAHLGEALTALVDGELDHAARERALAHLAHCTPCRGEVEAHRRLKATLSGLREAPLAPPPDLAARLLAAPARLPAGPPATPRPPSRPRGATRPASRPGRRPRRAATAGVLLVVGLAGALVLGAPATTPQAPVDPASPAFVADYVSTTSEVPLTEPAFATLVPAGAPAAGR